MKIKQKFADWVFENMSFPRECKTGNELSWIFKDNCPCCIAKPIEPLSNQKYHEKYPARNRIQIGTVTIYMCDYHLKELKEELNE